MRFCVPMVFNRKIAEFCEWQRAVWLTDIFCSDKLPPSWAYILDQRDAGQRCSWSPFPGTKTAWGNERLAKIKCGKFQIKQGLLWFQVSAAFLMKNIAFWYISLSSCWLETSQRRSGEILLPPWSVQSNNTLCEQLPRRRQKAVPKRPKLFINQQGVMTQNTVVLTY
jgi:hypothetical protein